MKKTTNEIEWIDFIPGNTKIRVNKRGFAHVLAFDGKKVFPCVYNNMFGTFVCKNLFIQGVKSFAYMPKVSSLF